MLVRLADLRSLCFIVALFGGCTVASVPPQTNSHPAEETREAEGRAETEARAETVAEAETQVTTAPEAPQTATAETTEVSPEGFTLPSCVAVVEAVENRDADAARESVRRLAIHHGRLEEDAPVTDMRGSLSREQIRTVISNNDDVRECYEEALVYDRELTGRLTVRFVIDPGGGVCHAESVNSPELSEVFVCLASRMRSWRFPEPEGGGIVVVNYPFMLTTPDEP